MRITRRWSTRYACLALALTSLTATAAAARAQETAVDPDDAHSRETQPTLPTDATWVVPLLLGLHGIVFVGAMVIGPIYRANVPQMVEVVRAREPQAYVAPSRH